MRKFFATLFIIGIGLSLNAQEKPEIGDEFIINKPSKQYYSHISFPKPNFIAKKGKIANYKSVFNNKVIVSRIETKKNGDTYIILKKKDGKKFFGYLSKVKANYIKSLSSGELSLVKQ